MSTNVFNKASELLSPKKKEIFFYGFLPENSKEYFDDGSGIDNDKKIKPSNRNQYEFTGSMNTTAIDRFRQGVEITRAKHFFAGTSVRIHAGEPGHVIKKNSFGMDRNYLQQNYYKELDYFDPVGYIKSEQFISYPLITSDFNETENYNFNGVIEPLTIRAVAAFYSIDVPFEAHSVKGMLMDGNSDMTLASNRIQTVYTTDEKYSIQPWLDLIDMVGEATKVPTMAFFNDDKTFINPFNDMRNKVQLSTNVSSDMLSALLRMNGSTENYISENEKSATCGWTYGDDSIKGTDSIAFGGFAY